jgi:hypothetical protein
MGRISSLVIKITAWYNWLLIILALVLGAYTCKLLDYCLSIGVQNALSIRAEEISNMFCATGHMPGRPGSTGPQWNGLFVSSPRRGDSARDLSGKAETRVIASGDLDRELHSLALPTRVVQRAVHPSGFLIATARSMFGGKEYLVEVRAPKKPIKAVFRQTAITMLIGLLVGLAVASLGSVLFVKRALAPVDKIARAVQALPVVHPDESGPGVAVLEQIERLCIAVNEMAARLEDSFQIGVGLPAEAFHAPGNRLGTIRGELANMFENERQSIGVAKPLLCLLKETERLSEISRSLTTPSREAAGQSRTERLRFYLGGLAMSGAEHVCALTKELGAELTAEARDPANRGYSVQW